MNEPWLKFYPTDWRSDPRLRMCGLAARGLWIEMIGLMHEATPYGHLIVSGHSPTDTQLAVLVGAPSAHIPELLGELEAAGVFSRTKEGVIFSRKMTRTAKKAAIARKNGKTGGNPTLRKHNDIPPSDNQILTDMDKPQKPEARYQKENKSLAQQQAAPHAAAPPNRFDRLLDQLLEANGIAGFRAERSPGLANLAVIIGLIEAGFDLDADILASIRQKPNPQARTWGYFEGQIRDYRDTRLRISKQAAPADPKTSVASWPAERWRSPVAHWRETGNWNRDALGPAPGEPGCLAPPDLWRDAA